MAGCVTVALNKVYRHIPKIWLFKSRRFHCLKFKLFTNKLNDQFGNEIDFMLLFNISCQSVKLPKKKCI